MGPHTRSALGFSSQGSRAMDMDVRMKSADSIILSSLHRQDEDSDDVLHLSTIVARNLVNLGAVPIDLLAESSRASLMDFDIPSSGSAVPRAFSIAQPGANTSSRVVVPIDAEPQGKTLPPPSSTDMRQVAELYDVCSQAFGIYEALRFEFLEDDGPNSEFEHEESCRSMVTCDYHFGFEA